jgi:hypothetical protein
MAAGVDLYRLNFEDPVCLPVTLLVGDDEGFVEASVTTTPPFRSRRLRVPEACPDPCAGPALRPAHAVDCDE